LHFGAEVEWMPRAAWCNAHGAGMRAAKAEFSNLHFVPSQWFASCFLARLCAGFCRHKMQEGNNYPSYISSFKIFKVASQYLYALGRNLLGSSSGSFSKLDQPCHPIPTLRLKPAGHLPKFPAVLKDSENGS
jgi:hypothetical protein